MRIIPLNKPKIIMSNPTGKYNYFAWPTVTRLQNGKIAVVASGFRIRHICPFGKTVISYSEDEGQTYTAPAPVIDTVLDDRDGGITPFGESGVIVTSFNNTLDFQRNLPAATPLDLAYLNTVTPEEEAQALGSTFRISHDCGVSFGEIFKSPVTSPHGPVVLKDGSLLWVGSTFRADVNSNRLEAHKINENGSTELVGYIEGLYENGIPLLFCEPHTFALKDGTLLTHIRVQRTKGAHMFTIYQSKSTDNGQTWSVPSPLLDPLGGSPPHIFQHSSGMLICTYGYRQTPFGVKAMFSKDNGETWDAGYDIYVNGVSSDLGYPSTVELSDGSMLTVFYAHPAEGAPAVIMQQRWTFEEN